MGQDCSPPAREVILVSSRSVSIFFKILLSFMHTLASVPLSHQPLKHPTNTPTINIPRTKYMYESHTRDTHRTDNAIKNRWNSTLQRMLKKSSHTGLLLLHRTTDQFIHSQRRSRQGGVAQGSTSNVMGSYDNCTNSCAFLLTITLSLALPELDSAHLEENRKKRGSQLRGP